MAQASKTKIETVSAPPASKQGHIVSAVIILVILLCLAVGIAGYFYFQLKHAASADKVDEVASLTKTLATMIELPEGETPTLATVTDKEKLANQPFFQKAENGDKILIFADSGRAILYRPSTKKIVDMTPVNVKAPETPALPEAAVTAPSSSSENAPAIQTTSTPTLALYNGSAKIGVTNTLEDEIKTKFPDVEVVLKDRAAKNDYQGNLVIDLSGKYADFAQKLTEAFGGTIGTLPEGETAPEAGILIIVGNKN